MTITLPVSLPIKAMQFHPGSFVSISDVTWDQYERLLAEFGEERIVPRIAYCQGTLEIMSPLPAHERSHRIIIDIVKVLLDAQEQDWEDFGSTTFKKSKQVGLEPDTCFYIQNAERVRDRQRIDLEVDPPPDLAIEADITSKTALEAYAMLKAPEVWVYDNHKLTIYLLQNGEYHQSDISPIFPNFAIASLIPHLIEAAFQEGCSKMLRELRKQLNASIP